MASIINLIRLWFLVSLAVARRVFRRLLLGPTLPSWTWRTDVTVAVARTAIEFAATVPDDPLINRFGIHVRAPVPPDLHGKVRVSRRRLGSLPADTYLRLGDATDAATILYFHGGGYVFGNPGTHRQHVARLVHNTGTTAVAPVYRLAPLEPFPAALDDAITAYRSLLGTGMSPDSIVVSGDSAGGGLALALLLSLVELGLPMPAGAVLFSPYTDLEHTSFTIETNAATDYLPINELQIPNRFYTGPENLSNPLVSPVYADLTGLPPLLVLAGGAEMILDDSTRLIANAKRDGVDATFHVADEMVHVWPAIVPWEPASTEALDVVSGWISSLYGGATSTVSED